MVLLAHSCSAMARRPDRARTCNKLLYVQGSAQNKTPQSQHAHLLAALQHYQALPVQTPAADRPQHHPLAAQAHWDLRITHGLDKDDSLKL